MKTQIKALIKVYIVAMLTIVFGCGKQEQLDDKKEESKEMTEKITEKIIKKEKATTVNSAAKQLVAKFIPTEIGVLEANISTEHRKVIVKLIKAANIINELFSYQVAAENAQWLKKLSENPARSDELAAFNIMVGPWDRLNHNKCFSGDIQKPKGANYYPKDLTKEELEKWINDHPEQKEAFTSYFTIIKRDGDNLIAIPYSKVYQKWLEPAAKLLDEAADLTNDKHLEKYLSSRAQAFRDNQYRQSDIDWMDLGDGDLEVVIGPYEVYEDELMSYKAAFETFIAIRDPKDSEELAKIKSYMPKMEAYLPIPDKYKNLNRGSASPISVVDVLYTSGDTRTGIQTLAFNLPNDEVVREQKGSKKVLLKNVAHAKFDKVLIPIANKLMREDQVKNITFKAFFNHTLVHETAHGLGPGKIKIEKNGKIVETSVNAELKDLYPTIEECKADILGAYLNYLLIEEGMFEESFMEQTYASLLGGFFRSVRFGASEAHGKGNIIQLNWFIEKGAVVVENGKYIYVAAKMKDAIKSLATKILMIEALGDYQKGKDLLDKYGVMSKELKATLESLDTIPTDLLPLYSAEKMMVNW